MKLSTSLVAVKKIKSNLDVSHFSAAELERAANLILEAEGIINPLVLQRVSRDSYEVIDGDFEYHAALIAKEKDPLKGEMIGAFILDIENEDVLKQQIELIRQHQSSQQATSIEEKLNAISQLVEEKSFFFTKQINLVFEQLSKIEQHIVVENQKSKRVEEQDNTDKTIKVHYASMTVAQLKKIAKEKEIAFPAKIKKADLIAAIEKNS